MRSTLGSAAAILSTCFVLGDHAPQRPTTADLRKEADRTANALVQFAKVGRDFFPDGLERAPKKATTFSSQWPPPITYSWRAAVLPYMEAPVLYRCLDLGSDDFKRTPAEMEAELQKRPDLKRELAKMPPWLTLPRWQVHAGKSIYRRVRVKDRPELFIVVESSDMVPWYKGGDDLELDEGKPLPKLGGNFPNGFFALCGDRQVRFIPRALPERDLRKALLSGEGVRPIRTETEEKLKQDIEMLDFGKKQ